MMATLRQGLFILLAWLALPAGASPQTATIELRPPRAFGYFAGDLVPLEALITMPSSSRLNTASLPRPRAVRPWLDLRDIHVEEAAGAGDGRRYLLHLTYQLLDAPMDAGERVIPPLALKMEAGGGLTDLEIPAWTLLMSPLRGANPGATGTPSTLMPDAQPPSVNAARHGWAVLSALAGWLACLLLLAWHYAWRPFQRRPARPFAAAWREIVARLGTGPVDASYRDSLLALHRAFDAAAGRRLFAADLDGFIEGHPQFRSLRHEIGQFFLASRRAFFAEDIAGASGQQPIEAICALSRKLSVLEREGA